MTTVYVNWGQSCVKLKRHPTLQPPRPKFITSSHGFCFHKEKAMLKLMVDFSPVLFY